MTQYLLIQLLLVFLKFFYFGVNASLLPAFLRISRLVGGTITEAPHLARLGSPGAFALRFRQVHCVGRKGILPGSRQV
jgi:hypothetical protein